jgi:hypothetical protein
VDSPSCKRVQAPAVVVSGEQLLALVPSLESFTLRPYMYWISTNNSRFELEVSYSEDIGKCSSRVYIRQPYQTLDTTLSKLVFFFLLVVEGKVHWLVVSRAVSLEISVPPAIAQ